MKKVLVVGGTGGLGRCLVDNLTKQGYFVYILGRNFTDYRINNESIKLINFDLNNTKLLANLINEIDYVDILINCAGVMTGKSMEKYTIEEIQTMVNINLISPIQIINTFIPKMLEKNFGRIINITSVAGSVGHPDIWYGLTKSGLSNATNSISHLLRGTNVTINNISPGPIKTDMIKNMDVAKKEYLKSLTKVTGKYLDPQNIVDCICFFIEEDKNYLNGVTLEVSDGVIWLK